jgi:PKD repeat protein
MKQVVLVLFAALVSIGAIAQQNICYSTQVTKQKRLIDPIYDKEMREMEQAFIKSQAIGHTDASYESRAVRTIPVVVHVVYNTTAENVSDATINAMIAKLNACYRKANTADISSARAAVQGFATDAQIEFCLAQRKPDGTATNGIDRVSTTVTSFSANSTPNNMKQTSTGGAAPWNPSKYLNIYICDLAEASPQGGIAGYAYLPTQGVVGSYIDGLVVDYQIGLGPDYTTAVHEIGHYLGLHHTWGDLDQNACGNVFPDTDDGFSDTPDSREPHYGCTPSTSCTGNSSYGDQHENFMDYSNCPVLFTAQQCNYMNSILTNSRGSLFVSNPACTPVNGPLASFTASPTTICAGQTVSFTNTSTGNPTLTYAWQFPGGTPSTSTAANPTVTYNAAGTYSVTLTTTNSQGSNVSTQSNIITVGGGTGAALPLSEGFESATFPPTGWTITNGDGASTWVRTTAVSGFGASSASAYVNNYNYDANTQKDWLITPSYNFSGVSSGRIRWEYAHAQYTLTSSADSLEVLYSTNCGATWTSLWRRGGSSLATATSTNNNFTPTAAQWKRDSVSLASLSGQTNVRFAFVNTNNYGNNTFLDNVNIYNASAGQVVAPVADFVGTPTTVVVGNTVAFTDLSTNSPTSWNWQFSGGTPATSTVQNPTITYNTVGVYPVTLTATNSAGNDVETKTSYITVVQSGGGVQNCDTLGNIFTADTPAVYIFQPGSYITGHNQYSDKAKAQYFTNTGSAQVTGGLFYFGVAKTSNPATSKVVVKVWAADGAGGAPGTVLAQQDLLINSIVVQQPTSVTFSSPANVTGNYYLGFEMTYVAGDTVALYSTTFNSPDPDYGWEQWSDNSWYAFSDVSAYPDGIDLYIFSKICSTSVANGPTASFTVNDQTVCAGTTVNFTSTSTGSPTSYSWSFTGGTPATSTAANPTVTYNTAGSYAVSLTVSNANGNNTATQSGYITVYAKPSLTTSSTAVACFGASTGTATVAATGTAPYTYSWSGGGSTATISGKPAGTYTVTVADANQCTATASVNIGQPLTALSATATATDATCNQANGSVTITATGGAGNYTYNWFGGATGATRTNLAPGNYNATVTDANQCTATISVDVASTNTPFSVSVNTVNASCGLNNGSATATVTNANVSVSSYHWSNGATTGAISNLPAGNYSVTVTLSNGCTASNSGVVSAVQSNIVIAFNATNATCGVADGAVTASATGGVSPYNYNWANGTNGATITAVAAGSYVLTVSDANGCSTTSAATVSNSGAPTIALTTTQPICYGSTNGSVLSSVSGGAAPYTYTWNTGVSTASLNNIGAGTYIVTVTDASQCQAVQSVVLANPAQVDGVISTTNATCGNNNGSATVNGVGGNGVYTYSWSTGTTANTLNGLASGSYSVTITDDNGCSAVKTATINASAGVTVSVAGTDPTQGNNGSATATVNGGTSPYLYSWSNGSSTSTISGLAVGTYTVTVTDANNCTGMGSVTLVPTGIKEVKGIASVKVYPNPTNGILNVSIELTTAQDLSVEIFNSIGQQMISKQYVNQSLVLETMDINSFAQGVYMVRVKANDNVKTIRLVKE